MSAEDLTSVVPVYAISAPVRIQRLGFDAAIPGLVIQEGIGVVVLENTTWKRLEDVLAEPIERALSDIADATQSGMLDLDEAYAALFGRGDSNDETA